MNKELTDTAERLAEERYPYSKRSVIDANFNYDQSAKQDAYLAGFEARDGMLNEEHAEMLDALRDTYHMLKNVKGYAYTATYIYNLINKIEPK